MKKITKSNKSVRTNDKDSKKQKEELTKLKIEELEDVNGGRAATPPWVEC